MNYLCESNLDLFEDTTAGTGESEGLARAICNSPDALLRVEGSGEDNGWVYQSIMHGMVLSGELKVSAHAFTPDSIC